MTHRLRRSLEIGVITLLIVFTNLHVLCGQQKSTADDSADPPKATLKVDIESLSWIAGHWKGEALGGKFEETWTSPLGGTMLGMFKLTKGDDQVNFTELLSIQPKGDSLVMRVKHFDSEFVGWETKDKFAEFPLIEVTDTTIKFDGLVFEKKNDDQMTITVRVGQKDGQTQNLVFNCQRATLRKPKK